jgi:hypothetical protein
MHAIFHSRILKQSRLTCDSFVAEFYVESQSELPFFTRWCERSDGSPMTHSFAICKKTPSARESPIHPSPITIYCCFPVTSFCGGNLLHTEWFFEPASRTRDPLFSQKETRTTPATRQDAQEYAFKTTVLDTGGGYALCAPHCCCFSVADGSKSRFSR